MTNNRFDNLKNCRPKISSVKINTAMRDVERFQNITLRPVLKLQNDLFLVMFHKYIKKQKDTFYQLGLDNRLGYVEHAIQKDLKFKVMLIGVVIGQFTIKEYEFYSFNTSSINKRITAMIVKRIQSQIQYFEDKQ